jgi:prepilin-type processing-associated H-X9-DG protein
VKTFGETSVTVHAWNLAAVVQLPLQLAWAVVGDQLVFELSAGEPGGSLEHVVKGGSSLADDPEFAKAASQFPRQMSHFSFTRDRERMASGMAQLTMLWSMAQMAASQNGVTLAPLPPVTDITQHLGYTSSCSWFDETGWHSRSSGSLAVADPVLIAGAAAGGVSILLPSLSRARELSKRLVSGSNIKGAMTSCKIYANENAGKFPPNMQVLIDAGDVTPRQFVNPRAGSPDAKDHYIYIPGHTESSPSDLVVIYENPAYVDEGLNIGFADGHVEFVRGEASLEKVRDTYTRMGLAVPELKFVATRKKPLLERFLPPTDAGKK